MRRFPWYSLSLNVFRRILFQIVMLEEEIEKMSNHVSPKQYGVHQGVLTKLMYEITNYGVQTIAYNFISTQRTAGGKRDTHF